jgi:mannosyltransferase OCH1-like enzyme
MEINTPKIIHHIAPKNKDRWHPIWDKCYPSWKKSFLDFEHKLWDDEEEIDALVREEYPDYWNLYSNFPVHIMKIDFAKFCILHKHGGIYADMDVFCYTNFYKDLKEDFHITEAPYGEQWMNGDPAVENCLMSSTKGNNFIFNLIDGCGKNYRNKVANKFDKNKTHRLTHLHLIGVTAGPTYISNKINQFKISKEAILPGEFYNNHGLSYDKKYKTKHMLTGMWGKETLDSYSDKNEMYGNAIQKYLKYAEVDNEIDFYKDYTNNQYI